jgi:hypothetical protein
VAHHRRAGAVEDGVVDGDQPGVVDVHAERVHARPALDDLDVRAPERFPRCPSLPQPFDDLRVARRVSRVEALERLPCPVHEQARHPGALRRVGRAAEAAAFVYDEAVLGHGAVSVPLSRLAAELLVVRDHVDRCRRHASPRRL